jgi:prepilin-type N-terminal cleavage/methylation domain-containing protein
MEKPSKKKGVTLIEIIISLAILSIVIIPLGNLALTSAKIEKDSETKLKANAISQQIIEYIKESSVTISNINTALMDSDLSLSNFDNDSIKNILVDASKGEKKEDFLFYKSDIKDCYVRLEISPTNYDAKAVVPKNEKTSIWENASFQYRIKIAKNSSNNLNLYDVSGEHEIIKKLLDATASTVINITGNETDLKYKIYQAGQEVVLPPADTVQNTEGTVPTFNLQIESNGPSLIVNVENEDENRAIKLFIDELIQNETYVANYKVYSKGKVGVYTKTNKKNESFSDVKKVYKVEVNVYTYKRGVKTLLQNLTDYKYIEEN